jgi:hypothetical protein
MFVTLYLPLMVNSSAAELSVKGFGYDDVYEDPPSGLQHCTPCQLQLGFLTWMTKMTGF